MPEVHDPTPGARGLGDPYYPDLGNGGYDVEHYALDLALELETGRLSGTATVTARATQDLSSFNLDLAGLEVESVSVRGAPATFARDSEELIVTPPEPIAAGLSFGTEVRYAGVPGLVRDAALPFLPGVGWFQGPLGVYALSEVAGAHGWFPCNDHPLDKATLELRVSVPKGYVAASNGRLVAESSDGLRRTFSFAARDPLPPYLVTLNVAQFALEVSEGAARDPAAALPSARRQARGTGGLRAHGRDYRLLRRALRALPVRVLRRRALLRAPAGRAGDPDDPGLRPRRRRRGGSGA
jgi:aminopeptidase N